MDRVDVSVENHLIRFLPAEPLDHQEAIDLADAQRHGPVVIKMLTRPKAMVVVDAEGRLVVHGTRRIEVARATRTRDPVAVWTQRSGDGGGTRPGGRLLRPRDGIGSRGPSVEPSCIGVR